MGLFANGPHCRAPAALALLLLASGCDSSVVGPGGNAQQLAGRLIYGLDDSTSGWPNSLPELRSIRPDGSDPQIYYASFSAYLNPAPDGQHVAFSSANGMAIGDGAGITFTHEVVDGYTGTAGGMHWSPDAAWVAYRRGKTRWLGSNRTTTDYALYVVSLAGTPPANVSALLAEEVPCGGGDPIAASLTFRQFTLDRMQFLWRRCGYPDRHYSIKPDGTDLLEIEDSGTGWISPDKSRVLYLYAGTPWTSDLDGGNAVVLSTSGTFSSSDWMLPYPWSPDGSYVALLRSGETCATPYVLAADGSSERPLAEEGCWMFHSWSPDGQWVAATRVDSVGAVIYLLKRDGSEQRSVTVAGPSLKVMDVAWLSEP